MKSLEKIKRFPLHFHITTLTVLLIIFLGATLSIYNYIQTTQLIGTASSDIFDQSRHEIELEFQKKYAPIAQTINLLTHTALGEATNLEQRLQSLSIMTAALSDRPELTAIEVAYSDGDFFIARVLNDQHMRKIFNAPTQARIFVDHIDDDRYVRKIERLYFDENLQQIGEATFLDTKYDPRIRPWYQLALKNPESGQLTDPYLYYFIRKVGVTYTQWSPRGNAVIAADIALDVLTTSVNQQELTPSSELLILDKKNFVLAYNRPVNLIQSATDNSVRLSMIDELGQPLLTEAYKNYSASDQSEFEFNFEGQSWQVTIKPLTPIPQAQFQLLLLTPERELFSQAYRIRTNSTLITLLLLIIALPLAWALAKRISHPLQRLASHSKKIQHFKFNDEITDDFIIKEVSELSSAMNLMQGTLKQFISLLNKISAEKNYDKLMELLTTEIHTITQSEAVMLYLAGDDEKSLILGNSSFQRPELKQKLRTNFSINQHCLLSSAFSLGTTQQGPLQSEDHDILGRLIEEFDHPVHVIAIPLRTRQLEMVGVLCLLVPDNHQNTEEHLAFTEAIAQFTSMTLESRLMTKKQKDLLQSFIELIANAIDAKSPYTGSHCQRVPELTRLLTKAACEDRKHYKHFDLNEEQWEALHIASWLHDCGKVTTPEYVVDKATKLETIYDRIHEVRMRFEVMKRDLEIEYWQQRAEKKSPSHAELNQKLKQLDDDFAFVATCNIGSESMDEESQLKLQTISRYQWKRTLDDRLGISHTERERRGREANTSLPRMESLLADKQHHLVHPPRIVPEDQQQRFNLTQPEYLFNHGELYNLSIKHGTLTPEERYIINGHIVQTILMLEQLPYPKHLSQVPLIAGGHHERMDGKGYPTGTPASELPLTSRIIALADIFEALTAIDRPYKHAKTLSESLRIMKRMQENGHIDGELFDLFLTSGVYKQYAERFLTPSQLEEINIQDYLTKPTEIVSETANATIV